MNWYQKCSSFNLKYGYAASWDTDRERVVIFGGFDLSDSVVSITREFYDSVIHTVTTASSPNASIGFAMAYDQARGETVLYGGGYDGDPKPLTWTYGGANWTSHSTADVPAAPGGSALIGAGMAYDPINEVVLLFGGYYNEGSDQVVNGLWAWDGTNWTDITPGTSPPGRGNVAFAWDPINSEMVLFAGLALPLFTALDDTWVLDVTGPTWTQKFPGTSPPARISGGLGGITGLGIVLYGALDASFSNLYDTWSWDGTDWTDLSPVNTPTTGVSLQGSQDLPESQGQVPMFIVGATVWDWLAPPVPTTDAATSITPNSAVLNGSFGFPVDQFGGFAIHWDIGETLAYGDTVSGSTLTDPAAGTHTDGGSATGLTAGTLYHFRAVIQQPGGCNIYGVDMTFETPGSQPALNAEFSL